MASVVWPINARAGLATMAAVTKARPVRGSNAGRAISAAITGRPACSSQLARWQASSISSGEPDTTFSAARLTATASS